MTTTYRNPLELPIVTLAVADWVVVHNPAGAGTINALGRVDITDLAPAVHTHVKADITDFTHTHLTADVTDLLTDAHVWAKAQSYGEGTLTDQASIAWDVEADPVAKVTLDGNRTLTNPTNMTAGATYILRVIQDGVTGGRTLAYGSAYLFPGGTAPTLSTAVSAVDILTFYCDGTYLYGVETLDFQ